MPRSILSISQWLLPLAAGCAAACAASCSAPGTQPAPQVAFETDIRPILELKCLECHNHRLAARHAELSLADRAQAFSTGRSAPVIRPGNPEGSPLYTVLVVSEEAETSMPPTPHKLAPDQKERIRLWILQGAPWPEGSAGALRLPF